MIDLSTLNPQQRIAAETTQGQVLVLAGAGSGKTKTLMHRIAYILDQKLANPYELLVVTFTNKAAGEMKERISKLLGFDAHNAKFAIPWMSTFHSMGVKILRRHGQLLGYSSNFTIYDTDDQQTLVKQAMEDLNVSIKDVKPQAIRHYISAAKNDLITPEEYRNFAQGYFQQIVADVYPYYQNMLKTNNAMDFDDLIMNIVKLFETEASVLADYQQQFKYIMVDEYQDTNPAQYKLIKMLAKGHGNLCVVGDDDQSIYAFRGATIKNILNFEKDYPESVVVKLEQNYRSTQKILEASYQVVSKNKSRKDKKLWTDNDSGENIVLYEAENEHDEAKWVASKISMLVDEGAKLSDFAILYRTNAQSRTLEEQMLRQGIRYKVVGATRFYQRKEIKDVIAYLQLIFNPDDETSMMRIINTPRRGIGAKTITDLSDTAKAHGMSTGRFLLDATEHITNVKLQEFAQLIKRLSELSYELGVVELLNSVLSKSGYLNMLQDGTLENESRVENIKELLSVAARFAELDPQAGLSEFLQEVSLFEGDAGNEEGADETVTLMTIHAAKGLEYKYVFVVGMEENLFPHSRVFTNPRELEEERRLAYVAITRAKQTLFLTHAQSRIFFGKPQVNIISRFVEDIDEKLVDKRSFRLGEFSLGGWEDASDDDFPTPKYEFGTGDRVKHDYFGVGKVMSIEDGRIEIDFGPVYGMKELILEFAPLKKV